MLKQAILNIKRYNSINMDMLTLIVLVLFFIGSSYLVALNFSNLSKMLEDKIQVAVFIKDNSNIAKAETEIKNQLEKQNILKDIIFVNKNSALEELKKNFNLEKEIGILDENPLKDHFILKFKDNFRKNVNFDEILNSLKSLDFVEDVVNGENALKNLNIFLEYISKIFAIFAVFLIIILVFLFRYTIKIYRHYRRKEFVLWNYLGVKKHFVIITTFLESLFISIFAIIFSYLILYAFYYLVSKIFVFNLIFFDLNFVIVLFIIALIISNTINFIVLLKSEKFKNAE